MLQTPTRKPIFCNIKHRWDKLRHKFSEYVPFSRKWDIRHLKLLAFVPEYKKGDKRKPKSKKFVPFHINDHHVVYNRSRLFERSNTFGISLLPDLFIINIGRCLPGYWFSNLFGSWPPGWIRAIKAMPSKLKTASASRHLNFLPKSKHSLSDRKSSRLPSGQVDGCIRKT